ncbi:recombinase family protein [Frankia sp. CiP3]|uniref:recombinase family protein n=1 Tax=Frankia sp. CiP3 TaxID=2880971 RepID=UPI001EF51AAB|nr:recombinase family protein [Frankia sp. CiP3]
MSPFGKITASQLRRGAVVYLRQSTLAQVERNRESTARQYSLVERAVTLGWPRARVSVIDADLGVSGASTAGRSGFAELTRQVALGDVGIVLALEVSRLARNNSDWYRLLDLAGMTDTLIADADGVYHPGMFNDRMLLGLKGTMSEAELHTLRARLNGGIRNKAARGELRRPLPVGLVWAEGEGEIRRHPDEAVTGVISATFRRFGEVGSVRKVWLWLREENLTLPLQRNGYATAAGQGTEVAWVEPTYHAVHTILTHPAYAGAYVYGRTRKHTYLGQDGTVRTRHKAVPRGEWEILIRDHHEGYIDWDTYETNLAKIGKNIRPAAHQPGTGAVREGCALLQGLATCGTCGRKLTVFYQGPTKATPGYYCQGPATIVDGRGARHLHIGGVALDTAIADAFLTALAPKALTACLTAAEHLENTHDTALDQHRRQVERARYDASRAERRYQAVDPDNRLVARGLEAAWEKALTELAAAEAELARREQTRPRALTDTERAGIRALGDNLHQIWDAPTTTDRDRKQLLRTLIDDVKVTVVRDDDAGHTDLLIRWKGGALTELTVAGRRRQPAIRTDEDTIDLIRRLAVHYPDATIAGILNRQGRRTARGLTFTATRVQSLRFHHTIPCHQPDPDQPRGELLTIADAAKELGIAASTLHRWLGDGFVAGEQDTPGAPWRIRMTDQLRNLFVDDAPEGWLAMLEATLALGVSRQTVMQRVKRGELKAVHVRTGRRKGLRIQVPTPTDPLF